MTKPYLHLLFDPFCCYIWYVCVSVVRCAIGTMLRSTSGPLGRTNQHVSLNRRHERAAQTGPFLSTQIKRLSNRRVFHRRWVTVPAALFVLWLQMFTRPWLNLWSPPSRAAADGGPHVVPGRLGFGEGAQLLRGGGVALQARSVLPGLGLLRSHRRNTGELPVCCPVRTGWDRHLQR